MQYEVWVAVPRLEGLAEIELGEPGARSRIEEDDAPKLDGAAVEGTENAPRVEYPHGVRAQLYAGPDLGECLRSLEDVHGTPALGQRQCCAEPTDSAAHDQRGQQCRRSHASPFVSQINLRARLIARSATSYAD